MQYAIRRRKYIIVISINIITPLLTYLPATYYFHNRTVFFPGSVITKIIALLFQNLLKYINLIKNLTDVTRLKFFEGALAAFFSKCQSEGPRHEVRSSVRRTSPLTIVNRKSELISHAPKRSTASSHRGHDSQLFRDSPFQQLFYYTLK